MRATIKCIAAVFVRVSIASAACEHSFSLSPSRYTYIDTVCAFFSRDRKSRPESFAYLSINPRRVRVIRAQICDVIFPLLPINKQIAVKRKKETKKTLVCYCIREMERGRGGGALQSRAETVFESARIVLLTQFLLLLLAVVRLALLPRCTCTCELDDDDGGTAEFNVRSFNGRRLLRRQRLLRTLMQLYFRCEGEIIIFSCVE